MTQDAHAIEHPHAGLHFLALLLPALLIALCLYQYFHDDSHYGLTPFSIEYRYKITYHWVHEDGSRSPHSPGEEITGPVAGALSDGRVHRWLYKFGSLERTVKNYLRLMHETLNQDGAPYCEAEIRYRINMKEKLHTTSLRHPMHPQPASAPPGP